MLAGYLRQHNGRRPHPWVNRLLEPRRITDTVPAPATHRTHTVRATHHGQLIVDAHLHLDGQRARWAHGVEMPLVSCLMVTRERQQMAERAIRCFQAQTYAARELVVVDDGPDDGLAGHVAALADPQIRLVRLPDEGKVLGELRQLSVAHARGTFVAQWDDDDLSDPERLEVQMAAITQLDADMCVLARERLWWPERELLALSVRRLWESSMVCAKSALPHYQALRRGEDTPVVEHVYLHGRVALLDTPELYTYVIHGGNTFDEQHFTWHVQAATKIISGADYLMQVARMAERLLLDTKALTQLYTVE